MAADKPAVPAGLLQVSGAGCVVREQALKLWERRWEPKISVLMNVHEHGRILSRLPEVLRHARAELMVSGWTHPDRAIRRSVGRSVDACCERLSKRTTPDFIGAFGQLPRLQKVSLLPSSPSTRVWNAARSIAGL